MSFPALFRRRAIWIPTIWGWLLALAIVAGALLSVGRCIHPFLALDEPVDAPLLVIEGWMAPEELDQAMVRFRNGNYRQVITTGGPVPVNHFFQNPVSYAELARDYLVRRGLKADVVTAVPAPESAQDRTFLSAVMVREQLKRSGQTVAAMNVYSSGVHSRRTRAVYQMAFGPDVRVGILAARPTAYDPEAWWTTSVGAKTVVMEAISWVWTMLFFHPPARDTHEEKWGRVSGVMSAK